MTTPTTPPATTPPATTWSTREATAFAEAAACVAADAPSRCAGWTAHDVLAHVVAGGAEIARLVGGRLRGDADAPTVPFAEREPPFRAVDYDGLVGLVRGGGLFELLGELADHDGGAAVAFTGWRMDAAVLARHVRSELALHRWDLVGSDALSRELLGQNELTEHAIRSLCSFDAIRERAATRTTSMRRTGHEQLHARLRAPGHLDVVIDASAVATTLSLAAPDGDATVTLDAAARLLLLWGRSPATSHDVEWHADPSQQAALCSWLAVGAPEAQGCVS